MNEQKPELKRLVVYDQRKIWTKTWRNKSEIFSQCIHFISKFMNIKSSATTTLSQS